MSESSLSLPKSRFVCTVTVLRLRRRGRMIEVVLTPINRLHDRGSVNRSVKLMMRKKKPAVRGLKKYRLGRPKIISRNTLFH